MTHSKRDKQRLAGDKVCLLRGKITHDTRDIFWLTIVFNGSSANMLPVGYEYDEYDERACPGGMRRLTVMLHCTISSSAEVRPPITAVAVQILTVIQWQDAVWIHTHRGLNDTGSVTIHRNLVSAKFQRWNGVYINSEQDEESSTIFTGGLRHASDGEFAGRICGS